MTIPRQVVNDIGPQNHFQQLDRIDNITSDVELGLYDYNIYRLNRNNLTSSCIVDGGVLVADIS